MNVLLFTRCPLAFIQSDYGQFTKRSGYAGTIDDFIKEYDNYDFSIIDDISGIIEFCDEAGINLSIYNYSKHKNEVLKCAAEFLSVEEEMLSVPYKKVNRSLSADELALARIFNKYFSKRGSKIIADPLCNFLPEVASQPVLPQKETLEKFANNVNKRIDVFNSKHGERFEPYDRIVPENIRGTPLPAEICLTKDQIDVIASSIYKHMAFRKDPAYKRVFKKIKHKLCQHKNE